MLLRTMSATIATIAFGAALAVSTAGTAKADETRNHLILAAGATSAPIPVPGGGSPVSLTCTAIVPGDSGVGQATFFRYVPPSFIQWVGTDQASNMGPAKVSQGVSATLGAHIIYCDYSGEVDVEVVNGTQIQVKNANGNKIEVFLHLVY